MSSVPEVLTEFMRLYEDGKLGTDPEVIAAYNEAVSTLPDDICGECKWDGDHAPGCRRASPQSAGRAPTLKVVAAFIAPDTQAWQGSTVNVTEDGQWWRWTGVEWVEDTKPLFAPSVVPAVRARDPLPLNGEACARIYDEARVQARGERPVEADYRIHEAALVHVYAAGQRSMLPPTATDLPPCRKCGSPARIVGYYVEHGEAVDIRCTKQGCENNTVSTHRNEWCASPRPPAGPNKE